MGVIPQDSRAAHIGRLRRVAVQTAAKGMSATVSGPEIRSVIAALDEATDRAEKAEARLVARGTRKPKADSGVRSFDDADVVGLVAATAEVLAGRPELWGQPLGVMLKVWCQDQGLDVPVAWEQILASTP